MSPKPQLLLKPDAALLDRIEAAAKAKGVTRQELVYGVLADVLPAGRRSLKAWRDMPLPGFPVELVEP